MLKATFSIVSALRNGVFLVKKKNKKNLKQNRFEIKGLFDNSLFLCGFTNLVSVSRIWLFVLAICVGFCSPLHTYREQ